jgi:hypothetical protein
MSRVPAVMTLSRTDMSKKIKHSIVIASVITGVAILLVVPSGIVSVVMSVLCFGLA